MAPSWIQILIVVILLVLLFGRGKISELMGDVAKGIKSFKKGMSEDETAREDEQPPRTIEHARREEAVETAKPHGAEKAKTG